jgi:hypothetical protein
MLTRALTTTSLLSVLAIGVGIAAADDKPTVTQTALEQCELYPLAKDTIWIYRSGPLEVREKVTRQEEFQGELCARIETFYEDRVAGFEHIAVRTDGVYRVAVGGKPVEPPLKLISLPAKPGVRWKVDSKIDGKAIRGEFVTSEGSFQARSPRGDQDQSFKTHRVTGETFEAGGEAVSFTYDFVPQLGKVRQTAKAHGLETTLELKEIVVAGQTPTRTAAGSSGLFRQ